MTGAGCTELYEVHCTSSMQKLHVCRLPIVAADSHQARQRVQEPGSVPASSAHFVAPRRAAQREPMPAEHSGRRREAQHELCSAEAMGW